MTNLWEADHAYYCNEGNYFATSPCGADFKTWADFIAAEGDADLDMNLLFRWDWIEENDDGESNFTGDVYYRNGVLKLFYMGQRKGLYRWATVEVCRADEPAVRAWLQPRLNHLMSLWAPMTAALTPQETR